MGLSTEREEQAEMLHPVMLLPLTELSSKLITALNPNKHHLSMPHRES